jgi:hypothetical protein
LLQKSMTSFWLSHFWLGQNFTYFYVHNFSEEQVLLAPNPTIG